MIFAHHRSMCWDHDDFESIDGLEFEGFRICRAGHAGQLRVHAEVVLECDRCDGLVLFPNAHAFFRLDRLVQTIRPASARHGASGELIDDHDFAITYDVLDVTVIE